MQSAQTRRPSILFAGGGTGGHLYPALAIADEIRKVRPEVEIVFVGTKEKIEARVVPERGYRFVPIWISGFRRALTVSNVLFPLKVLVSLGQCFLLLRRIRPAVVVGTGGYVSGPAVFMAWVTGVPTLLQEQNSYPGVTTRLLAHRATEVHLAFEKSAQYLRRKDNLRISGNPTRGTLGTITRNEAALHFGIDPRKKTVLVFGGSLGASSLNLAVEEGLEHLAATGVQVIWQTGERDFDRAKRVAGKPAWPGQVTVHRFIERMEYAYAACDVAVCRAGATTVAELARAGVPSVLVPYPFAAADHQTENARALVEAGAAVMLADREVKQRLREVVTMVLDNPTRLEEMAARAQALAKPGAAAALARAVLELAKTDDGRTGKGLPV